MMTHSLYFLLKDGFEFKNNQRYSIKEIQKIENNYKIICETLIDGVEISFSLQDLIEENKLQYFNSKDVIRISSLISDYSQDKIQYKNFNFKYYHLLALSFFTCLLVSNLAATKLISVGNITLPGGIFIFPIIYVLNDTLTEVYGFTASRKVIWGALLYNSLVTMILVLVCYLPPSDYWHNQKGFEEIFLMSPRILIASILSYLIGEGINASVMSILKFKFKGKFFATRALISTSLGAFLETFIFASISFLGYLDLSQILTMVVIMSVIKIMYELCVMPFTVKLVMFLKREEDIDVYELPTLKKLIPFSC
jgi:uncharacterized integral membrane protein (TIGR00697 family)